MLRHTLTVLAFVVGLPAAAAAQSDLAGCKNTQALSETITSIGEDGNHMVFDGRLEKPVQIDCDDMQLQADHLEYFKKEGNVTARGHVVFVSGGSRITSERMEFNTKTRTGTFYVASGTAVLREAPDPSLFGGQEPDMMFEGDEIHKLGPKKYKIVHGRFTTCVQPTPRWEMVSGSITMVLDDYAFLRNTIFKVKNVPVMYLPAFYYPIQEDDRATGFVMPIYGTSTIRGQSLSNAFFWAINRSQDATFYHDWFSKTGQQFGSEYRYIAAPGSQGNVQFSMLNEHEAKYALSTGGTSTSPARKSYTVDGTMTQRLPHGLNARANANLFSSINTQQKYQQNIYQATNQTRRFGANLTGAWGSHMLSVTAERSDLFSGETTFTTNGTLPRITFTQSERPLGTHLLYGGVTTEFVSIQRSTTTNDAKLNDQGLSKLDVSPTLRIPFTRWPFLTINSSVGWRGTYWTESLDDSSPRQQIAEPIGRQYFDFVSRVTGPVFNRIFNTPGNGYAEKFKHVIEPTVSIQRTTAIDNFDRIVQLEGSDFVRGNVTSFRYALGNRLYAKKTTSREILSAVISQSYYTDERAAQYDRQYQSNTFSGQAKPTHFSPVRLQVRGSPSDRLQGDFSTEWNQTEKALTTLAANGTINGAWVQGTGGWSQRRFVPGLPGFELTSATNFLNGGANVRRPGSRIGGNYSFNYDLKRDVFLQQRLTAYYNAQCCGVAIEYQTFNLQGSLVTLAVPNDRRFNLSFTLAGIGTFSNLFGAFGGGQRR